MVDNKNSSSSKETYKKIKDLGEGSFGKLNFITVKLFKERQF